MLVSSLMTNSVLQCDMHLYILNQKKQLLLLILNTTSSTRIINFFDRLPLKRLVIIAEISLISLRTAKRNDGLLPVVPILNLLGRILFNNGHGILIQILNLTRLLLKTTFLSILRRRSYAQAS